MQEATTITRRYIFFALSGMGDVEKGCSKWVKVVVGPDIVFSEVQMRTMGP